MVIREVNDGSILYRCETYNNFRSWIYLLGHCHKKEDIVNCNPMNLIGFAILIGMVVWAVTYMTITGRNLKEYRKESDIKFKQKVDDILKGGR